jgi:polar amino acid transport system substrate-binding protein
MTSVAALPWRLPTLALMLCAGVALLCIWVPSTQAQSGASAAPVKLVVGTMRVPPFVLRSDDGRWSGLSIDLWQQIAAEMKVPFEFREYDYDYAGLLDAVERHEVDAAVAAIPVTLEGEARFDYSHPYFSAGLGIAVRTQPQGGILGTLSSFLSYQLLAAVAALAGLLLFVGALIWALERRQNAQHFDPHPVRGVADGVWWAAVTLTTTGYGDKVPISWRGRSVALVWMFASNFCIAFFSAALASSFIVGRLKTGITGPEDLPRARVAAVAGSAGAQWLGLQRMSARSYPFVIQASKALQRGDVDALIYEKAILGHMIKEYGWRELQVLPHTLAVREYAIALPTNSPLKEPINRALLKVVQGPDWKSVVQHYVGATDQVALTDQP